MCQTVLKDGYDFLRIFQSQDIKIHLLYEAFTSLLRDVLLDICEGKGLKTTTKKLPLPGYDLKVLVLETRVERNTRREKEKFEAPTKSKMAEFKRYCQLLEPDDVLLGNDLRRNMNDFFIRHEVPKKKQDVLLDKAKEIKQKFLLQLAKAYQHYLPLDNDFLRYLQYVCPKKLQKILTQRNIY